MVEVNPLYDSFNGEKLGDDDDVLENEEEELSQDLNDLVRALKTGDTFPDEHVGNDDAVELKYDPMKTDKMELRRLSIADTHV